jgi:hypothetical protein
MEINRQRKNPEILTLTNPHEVDDPAARQRIEEIHNALHDIVRALPDKSKLTQKSLVPGKARLSQPETISDPPKYVILLGERAGLVNNKLQFYGRKLHFFKDQLPNISTLGLVVEVDLSDLITTGSGGGTTTISGNVIYIGVDEIGG